MMIKCATLSMSSAVSLACRCPLSASSFAPRRYHQHLMAAAATCCLSTPRSDSSIHHLPYTDPSSSSKQYCNYLDFSRPSSTFPDLASSPLLPPAGDTDEDADEIWAGIRHEAELDSQDEPFLRGFYEASILSHPSLESSLAAYLAAKLGGGAHLVPAAVLFQVFMEGFEKDPTIGLSARADLRASRDRDPACLRMVHCFLYYKGFLALQAHRVSHRLWLDGRKVLALFLQGRVSEVFAVDVHPGARVGSGILLDHATGVVIGETAVVGDDVSILHNVTLGGTGKVTGDRHPKIGDGVLIGAGTQILGSVRVGEGAKIGAGSVVLKEVPPRTTAVGNPAKLLGGKENPIKLDQKPSLTMDHTSWSDYVI